jgi:2-polyprenyl-6-methoxyphenol hydroxylase-like FAD-dependent oxidoreductase
VIGCDGRRSILRPLMDGIIEQPERNLGLSRITFDVPGDAFNATENHDLAFVGEGCLAMITRFAGRLRVSLAFPSNLGKDEPMETYRNITRFWLRPVNELVDHIDMDSVVKSEKLMDRDAPRLLSDNGKYALAGDALYCLSPFSGHAGGIALADAITIGHSIASDGHLLQYWQQIEKNSSSLVNDSRGKLAFMHSANVIEELKKLDSKRGTDQNSDSV